MSVVLDCSVTAGWLIREEASARTEALLEYVHVHGAVTPRLWWYEIRNVAIVNEWRKRVTPEESEHFLRMLGYFNIEMDQYAESDAVLSLARRHRITIYDASYLELAARKALPLATLDKELVRAAKLEHIEIV